MMLLGVIIPWMILLRACLAQQDLMSRLPDCAVPCFEAALPITTCSSDDISCLCSDAHFFTAVAACNVGKCTVVETLKSTNETHVACGVPVRDQTNVLIGTTASFGAMALLMVIMRLLDRGISAKAKLGWDDLLIGLAGLSSVVQNVPAMVAADYGFGRDMWGMTPEEITGSLRWLYFAYPLYMTTEAFCQLSILAFYLRILTDRKIWVSIWSLMVFVAAFGFANLFAMVFQCWPINYFWDGWKGQMIASSVIKMNLFSFIRGGIEIALDLIILCLPLPTLARLQMSSRKKLKIMSMFCVGFVITGVSCARLHALVQFAQTSNPTYDNTSTVYWCLIESNLFIVVACMPAIYAILQKTWSTHLNHNTSGCANSGKNPHFSNSDRREKSGGSLRFGEIWKSTDVNLYRTDRSDLSASDVDLVDRLPYISARYGESYVAAV